MNTSAHLMMDEEDTLAMNPCAQLNLSEEDAAPANTNFRTGFVLIVGMAALFYGGLYAAFH